MRGLTVEERSALAYMSRPDAGNDVRRSGDACFDVCHALEACGRVRLDRSEDVETWRITALGRRALALWPLNAIGGAA